MIILILGGIGSGKTLSIIKQIIDTKQYALTNFKLKGIDNYSRIKVSDIIKDDREKKTKSVNWEYWDSMRKNHDSYSIYLDEIHNLIHSRRSMTKTNILMSKWISQIRKILSDHPKNHIYCISQTIRKIDVDFRELAQIVIECSKVELKSGVFIRQRWYNGVEDYLMKRKTLTTAFKGDRYFKHYDTRGLVTFSDADEYI